jgi:hypothetical protein
MAMDLNFVNVIQFFSYISPLLLGFFMLMSSFFNGNIKGLVYLGGAMIAATIGLMLQPIIGSKKDLLNASGACDLFEMPFYGNSFNSPSLHSLFIAFTTAYLFMPMISNDAMNYPVLISLVVLFCVDAFTKTQGKCTTGLGVFVGGLLGVVLGLAYWAIFHYAGMKSVLYFEPEGSNNVVCNRPSRQTFKCKVYKGGKLIGSL